MYKNIEKKISISLIAILVFMTGTVYAAPEIKINPDMNPILVPVGSDAYQSIGLELLYIDWNCQLGCGYGSFIKQNNCIGNGCVVWSKYGTTHLSNWNIPVHWIPADIDKTYTLYAGGIALCSVKTIQRAIDPVPESGTNVLVVIGIIGLLGLTRFKKV